MTKSWARIILFVRSFLPNNFTGNPVLCNWVNITPLSALLVLVLLTSCVSVKKFNEKLSTPVAAEKLKADVDYAYASLQELHPELYWYISKDSLDRKFEAVKKTIDSPLTPAEFYRKLAPVVADVRQGHLRLVLPDRKLNVDERKALKLQKGLFSRYNYVVEEDRIFVKDNADKIPNMEVGTEILKINDAPASELISSYRQLNNSDGYNTTFLRYSMAKRWPYFFTAENGILDSVKMETRFKDSIQTFWLKREKITAAEKKTEKEANRKLTKSEKGKTKDYNIITRSFNRDLQFPTKDSTVAYMKIKTFSGTFSKRFYRESFRTINNSPANYLIIDMRDNLGGSLSEINNLYSYLTAEKFRFIKDIQITKPGSMFQADYFRMVPNITKPIAAVAYPFYLAGTAFSIKKTPAGTFLRNNGKTAVKKPNKDHFKGKVYVLINGSSFSAASILPAKLKDAKRAILVGEETGGANDGTVAGRYSTRKLKNSGLQLPIGLMLIQPDIEFSGNGKGVIPHHEIIPDVQQILQKKDIQLEWILQDIKKDSAQSTGPDGKS
ncbi:peptidase S41 [Marnyiella aurantia]|uniref:Peptidase S41 n=1 Tax=Marnyiella aurantia TaxID=2758037 RepID=A0A7D7QER2_9FLAO|nr:S41 family peptidase [Marnyiella aurantia]MBA5246089.1 peptidase S41 [Marnyiella aurantia]QMS98521.1 peptidase S41 [Marnyiella aurantia]